MRGADSDRHDLTPQSAGLLAISIGLRDVTSDDHDVLTHGLIVMTPSMPGHRSAKAKHTAGLRRQSRRPNRRSAYHDSASAAMFRNGRRFHLGTWG
nr:hypothetical protein [Mesorhizobium sp. B3-2-1]